MSNWDVISLEGSTTSQLTIALKNWTLVGGSGNIRIMGLAVSSLQTYEPDLKMTLENFN